MRKASASRSLGIPLIVLLAAQAGCDLPRSYGERGVLSQPTEAGRTSVEGTGIGTGQRRGRAIENVGTAPAVPTARVSRVSRTLPAVSGDRQVQLDYTDVEISRVAREVVGDILGLPVSVDSSVSGRMTLTTQARVPISEVPERLDQALQQYGYGLAAIGGRVRVGRLADLEASGGSLAETRIIPVTSVQPADVLAVVQQNLPDGARVAPDPGGRGIVVSGPPTAVASVEEMVRLFDVDAMRSRSFGLYPLANTTPAAVVRELGIIFTGGRGAAAGVRFAPVDRLNAVLVVADQPSGLQRARRAITQLDSAPEATTSVHVYPIQYRRAADLADILSRTFGATNGGGGNRNSPSGNFGGLSVGSPDGSSTGLPSRVPGAPAATPQAAPIAATTDPAPSASQVASELGLSAPVRIQADTGRNALVVLAAPADFRVIEQAIRRMDVRPRQVFIEAVIAEVNLTDSLKYGIDYSLKLGSSSVQQLSNLGSLAGGFAYVLTNSNIGLTIQALSSITDVKVVSAPRVLVLDNETATLQVGNQVPILTRVQQSTDAGTAPVVNQVELRDTGVILAVKARIGAGGGVTLDLFQEVSDAVTTDSSTINSPTIQLRRLQSAISVQSGDTIALGGLMQDRSTRSRSGIPYLSSIPVIGALFGTRQGETRRSELLILLTPRVVDNTVDAEALTNELRGKLESLAPEMGVITTPPAPALRNVPPEPPNRALRLNANTR